MAENTAYHGLILQSVTGPGTMGYNTHFHTKSFEGHMTFFLVNNI